MENEIRQKALRGMPAFYTYVALFPILPSYTCLFGYPVYYFLTIAVGTIILALNMRRRIYVKKPFLLGVLFIPALYIISFLVNEQPERILFEVIDVLLPILLICFVLKNDSDACQKSISIILTVSFIIGLSGLLEEITGFNVFSLIENRVYENPRFGSIQATRWGMTRIEQGFNTALTYALYQSLCFAFAFYRFLSLPQKQVRYLIIMLVQGANIVLTWTRGVTFAFIAGVAGMFFLNRKEFGFKRSFSIISVVICSVSFLLISDASFLELFGRLFGAGLSILLTGSGGRYDDASISMRENYQRVAFEALKEPRNFLFGVGEYGVRDMISIDNEFLLELTAYGILGLLAFVLLLAIPIYICIRNICKPKRQCSTSSKMFYNAMLMSCLVYSASMFTVAQMAEARMFYLTWGLVVCFRYSINRNEVQS